MLPSVVLVEQILVPLFVVSFGYFQFFSQIDASSVINIFSAFKVLLPVALLFSTFFFGAATKNISSSSAGNDCTLSLESNDDGDSVSSDGTDEASSSASSVPNTM